jgi:hypothetical protein
VTAFWIAQNVKVMVYILAGGATAKDVAIVILQVNLRVVSV